MTERTVYMIRRNDGKYYQHNDWWTELEKALVIPTIWAAENLFHRGLPSHDRKVSQIVPFTLVERTTKESQL